MKVTFLSLTLVVTLAVAFPVDDNHYVQHQSSVDAAREGLQQRLSQLEQRQGATHQRLSSGGYPSNCMSCVGGYSQNLRAASSAGLSSSLQSSSSSNVVEGSDYVGVGYVGHANNKNLDTEDVQTRVAPSALNYGSGSQSRYSSSNVYEHEEEEEEEDTQQRIVPSNLSGIGASAYRASSQQHTAYDDEDTQKTVGVGYHDAAVNTDNDYYSRRRQQQQQQQYSESETTRSNSQIYYVPAPVISTTGQRQAIGSGSSQVYRVSARPGTSTVLQVPVRVNADQSQQQYVASNRASGYQASESSLNQPSQRVITYYVPATSDRRESSSLSRSDHESSRTSVVQQQPLENSRSDFTAYNSFNAQSRSQAEDLQESDLQTRIKPVYTPIITDGGSSRYASTGSSQQLVNSQRTQSRVVPPVFPINSIESSSSALHRTAEEQQQRQQVSARPSYVQRTSFADEGSSTRRTAEASSSYGSSGATVYRPAVPIVPITTQSRLQSQSQLQNSQYNSNSRAGNVYSPYSPSYSSSSRLGSGVLNTGSDNLHEYMSESQRLAELQQRQLAASQSSSSASNLYSSASELNRRTLDQAQRLDSAAANYVGSSNLLNRNSELDTESVTGAGSTGYQRVKQWQKQSKWESGSQYGSDGTPKTYSMLSTAEAEKHNINGAETGYKAATTTLENDGKVSTYSIHTP